MICSKILHSIVLCAFMAISLALLSIADSYGKDKVNTENIQELEKSANQGDTASQAKLGYMYLYDPEYNDYDKAKFWLEKAAMKGDDKAQHNLGNLYKIENDVLKSIEWYEKAAAQGNAVSQFDLGRYYLHGEVISKDFEKAKELFNKSSENGFCPALAMLGRMYLLGLSVKKDCIKAYELINKSADGCYQGQYELANMYYGGLCVKKIIQRQKNYLR